MRLRRSLHFVPGANEKMMGKALTLGADALIFDEEVEEVNNDSNQEQARLNKLNALKDFFIKR